MLRKLLPICGILFLASCTTPNVNGEIAVFSQAVGAALTEIDDQLKADAEAERRLAYEARIASGQDVYNLSPECALLELRLPDIGVDECRLVESYDATNEAGSATRAWSLSRDLKAYLAALDALSLSQSPSQIATSFTVTIGQAESLTKQIAESQDSSADEFAARLAAFKQPVSNAAGFAAEQAQFLALRQSVNAAGPAVDRAVEILIIYFNQTATVSIEAGLDRVHSAELRMIDARSSGSAQVYRQAVENFRAEFEAFVKSEKASPAHKLFLIGTTHRALARRLNSPSDPEEVLDFLERLKILHESFVEANESG